MEEWKNRQDIPFVTIVLAASNVVFFLLLEITGSTDDGLFMLQHGALYGPLVLEDGEYYRLFTAMFMHFGASHLMNNLLMLMVMGSRLEQAVGRIRYLICYLVSGAAANLFTVWFYEWRGIDAISAGASGALLGVCGALFGCVLRKNRRLDVDGRQMLILMAFTLYSGFVSSQTNNAAHISGAFFGFLLGLILGKGDNDARSATFQNYS